MSLAYSLPAHARNIKRSVERRQSNWGSGRAATREPLIVLCAWAKLLTRHGLSETTALAMILDSTERARHLRDWVWQHKSSSYVPEEILGAMGIDDEQVLRGRADRHYALGVAE